MKKKKILWLILISSFFLVSLSGISSAEHAALNIMKLYAADLKDMNAVDPYLVSMLALNEVDHNRHTDEVRQFILWYFSKLNYPDYKGLTGTIYDYVIENGRERSTNSYDSVDGYAGIFLHLVHQYVLGTGDLDILQDNWSKIEDIVYLIPFLQDKDGLTKALSDTNAKYLMDNCESYGGVSAYIGLRTLLGKESSTYYKHVRNAIKKAVLTHLYEPRNGTFDWAVENDNKSPSNWKRFYPDAYAQLFPIYFDLLAGNPELKQRLWKEFTRRYAAKVSGFPIEQRIFYEMTKRNMEGILRR